MGFSETSFCHVKSCTEILSEISQKLSEHGIADQYNYEIKTPTVRSIKSEPGQHGGTWITLERIGETWSSAYTTVRFDNQGDPRWFIEVAGEEVAAFFGFKIIDDKHMRVPDFTEFNHALEKMNLTLVAHGEEKLPIQFYLTKDESYVPLRKYVQNFLDEQAIPMAPSGNHMLHDLSFHTGGIFLPPELIQYQLERMRYESAFFNHLHKIYKSNPAVLKAIAYYRFLNDFEKTIDIDIGTADVNPVIPELRFLKEMTLEEFFGERVGLTLTGMPHSPEQRFIETLTDGWLFRWAQLPHGVKFEMEKWELAKKHLPVKKIIAELKKFTQTYPVKTNFNPQKSFAESNVAVGELICRKINEKRLLLLKMMEFLH